MFYDRVLLVLNGNVSLNMMTPVQFIPRRQLEGTASFRPQAVLQQTCVLYCCTNNTQKPQQNVLIQNDTVVYYHLCISISIV